MRSSPRRSRSTGHAVVVYPDSPVLQQQQHQTTVPLSSPCSQSHSPIGRMKLSTPNRTPPRRSVSHGSPSLSPRSPGALRRTPPRSPSFPSPSSSRQRPSTWQQQRTPPPFPKSSSSSSVASFQRYSPRIVSPPSPPSTREQQQSKQQNCQQEQQLPDASFIIMDDAPEGCYLLPPTADSPHVFTCLYTKSRIPRHALGFWCASLDMPIQKFKFAVNDGKSKFSGDLFTTWCQFLKNAKSRRGYAIQFIGDGSHVVDICGYSSRHGAMRLHLDQGLERLGDLQCVAAVPFGSDMNYSRLLSMGQFVSRAEEVGGAGMRI